MQGSCQGKRYASSLSGVGIAPQGAHHSSGDFYKKKTKVPESRGLMGADSKSSFE